MAGYIATSATVEWPTPQDLFDKLDARFGFTLDVAADSTNAKCGRFFTKEDDGLSKRWTEPDGSPAVVWCNPPYGRVIAEWVKKAHRASFHDGSTVVMLVPARTDTAWFHDYVLSCAWAEVEFIRGRLKFGDAKVGAPFPSMLVIFHGGQDNE